MKKLLLVMAASVSVLTGCQTYSISPNEAKYIPPTAYGVPSSLEDIEVIIVRDSGVWGAALASKVTVNDTPTVTLYSSEMTKIYLPVGRHYVGMRQGPDDSYETIVLEKDERPILRIHSNQRSGASIDRIR